MFFIPTQTNKSIWEMEASSIKMMRSKFDSTSSVYSYLIFVLLYIFFVSVMSAIAQESSRRWVIFSILWRLNTGYSLSTLFYQVATFNQHPRYELVVILVVVIVNLLLLYGLRKARKRFTVLLGDLTQNPCCKCTNKRCH